MFSRTQKLKTQGFSLVELLVSIAIFAIVITMAVGSLMVIIDANARAQNMQDVMVNLQFAVDSMTREIRTGRAFYCSDDLGDLDDIDVFDNRDCESGGDNLSIVEGGESLTAGAALPRVAYRLNPTDNTIDRQVGEGDWLPITADNVTITDLVFTVTGTGSVFDGDDEQAQVSIYIEGWAGELQSTDSSFRLQTSITRRVLDI